MTKHVTDPAERVEPGYNTLTVEGLIRELQHHVYLDPDRANDPVEVWETGGNARLVPVVAFSTGNDDPAVGGHHKVVLLSRRSPKPADWPTEQSREALRTKPRTDS